MISAERAQVLLIMTAAVVALALGETALARGVKPAGARGIEINRWLAAGAVLMVLHLGLYLLALRRADLSFVLPLTAASYPLTALLARFYLREDVGTTRWLGTLLIAAGVLIVALGDE